MSAPQRPPNILLIITDQQRADCVGAYGNRLLKTPSIDRIAENGVRFNRFHVATPICMPNRASLMTGRMPSGHGVRYNGIALSRDDTTFVEVLRRNGYDTALIGKSHLQNFTDNPAMQHHIPQGRLPLSADIESGSPRRNGIRYEQETPHLWADPAHHVETPFYGFDEVTLATNHGDAIGGDYRRWLEERLDGKAKDFLGPENALPRPDHAAPQVWCSPLDSEQWSTNYLASESCDWIEQRSDRQEPFFLQVSFPDPHHPFVAPEPWFSLYDPADIELPANFSCHAPQVARHLHKALAEGTAIRDRKTAFAVTEEEARVITAVTYGMIALIDDAVGRLLASLDKAGIADNTIVIFMSDHGDFLGDYGLMAKLGIHCDGVTRTPFLWADPRKRNGGEVRDDLASAVDLAPTVLAAAGIDCFYGAVGRDLFDDSVDAPEGLIIEEEAQRPMLGFKNRLVMRTLLTRDWRMTVYPGNEGNELINLADDPKETINLWSDPQHQNRRARLSELMVTRMIELTDRAILPTALA